MRHRVSFIIIFFTFLNGNLFAQTKTFTLSGVVKQNGNTALENATVLIENLELLTIKVSLIHATNPFEIIKCFQATHCHQFPNAREPL